jgi:exonuclease III
MNTTILQWNANSLNAHAAELKRYISIARKLPDIICVQETFLKPESKFKINGFNSETKCRNNAKGGGVAIFIREGIKYYRQPVPEILEAVSIVLVAKQQRITITNIYISPNNNTSKTELQAIFGQPNTIICGDLNAKNTLWGSPANDSRGKLIGELLEENRLTVLNTGCRTYIKQDGTMSHLDISVASSNLAAKCNWRIHDETWGSDHLPAFTLLNEPPEYEEVKVSRWNFKKADWSSFKNQMKIVMTESS